VDHEDHQPPRRLRGEDPIEILLTGITGFIGSHLADVMQTTSNHHVVGMIRNVKDQAPLEARGIETRIADLLQPVSLTQVTKDVDVVVHLAALMRFHAPWNDLYASNVEATKHLANDAAAQGVRHFIYISSTEAVGPVDTIPGDESAPYHPTYDYGRTKMLAEQWLHTQEKTKGLPLTILRPTGVYGPGDDYITLPMLRAVKQGKLRMLPGKADHQIQFTYVHDVAKGIIAAISSKEQVLGKTIFLASDDAVTYRGLFTIMAQLLDVPPPTRSVPPWLASIYLRYLEWTNARKGVDEFIFHPSLVKDMQTDRVYSNALARRLLGFQPQYTLREGMDEAIRWYTVRHLL